jgi:hypothetical protein
MGEHRDRWDLLGAVTPARVAAWGVGVSDGLDAAGGFVGVPLVSNEQFSTVTTATRALNATNSQLWVAVSVLTPMTATGIRYRKGTGTTAANVRAALYDADGERVANRSTNQAQGNTASATVVVAFDTPVDILPGTYWLGYIGSATAADFWGWNTTGEYYGPAHNATQATFVTATSFTPPSMTALHTATVKPWLQLY